MTMKTGALIGFMLGLVTLIALVIWQGIGEITAALAAAGWGLLLVTAFHLLPMLSSSQCWRGLFPAAHRPSLSHLLQARWIGESINGLLPVAQIGGELAKARWIMQHSIPGSMAGASVVVEMTITLMTQILFTLIGLVLLLLHLNPGQNLVLSITAGMLVITILLILFYSAQRQRFFGKIAHLVNKVAGGREWLSISGGADQLDTAIEDIYGSKKVLAIASAWRLLSWIVGTGEVWLLMFFLGLPVSLAEALLLESLGQAIRAAGFLIPASLGIQEGGFLLLGTVLGIPPHTALALSLGKRIRELLLGLPGLLTWQFAIGQRFWQRRQAGQATQSGSL